MVARLDAGVSPAQAEAALTAALAGAPPVVGEPRDRVAVTTSLRLRLIGTKQRDMATFVLGPRRWCCSWVQGTLPEF